MKTYLHGFPGYMLCSFPVLFFSEMTKLLQVAVPVVLAMLSLMPRVDAPTHAGMYMQINVKTI